MVSKPQTWMAPELGGSTVTRAFIKVDLPAPLWPSSPKTPLPTEKDTSSKAVTPPL